MCLIKENRGYKHGLRYTKGYSMWQNMKDRCLNPKGDKFEWYGARGITICEEWLDIIVFNTWYNIAKGGIDDSITSIHRVNNDLGYTPENCIIITISEHNKIHGNLNIRIPTRQELEEFKILRKTKTLQILQIHFKCGQKFIYRMKGILNGTISTPN